MAYVATTDDYPLYWDDERKAKDFMITPLLNGMSGKEARDYAKTLRSMSLEDLVNHKDTAGSFKMLDALPEGAKADNHTITELYKNSTGDDSNPFESSVAILRSITPFNDLDLDDDSRKTASGAMKRHLNADSLKAMVGDDVFGYKEDYDPEEYEAVKADGGYESDIMDVLQPYLTTRGDKYYLNPTKLRSKALDIEHVFPIFEAYGQENEEGDDMSYDEDEFDDEDTSTVATDVNNDGDADVTETDTDGDGDTDEVEVDTDSPEETEEALDSADTALEDEREDQSDDEDTDIDSTATVESTDDDDSDDTQKNITSALLDHRL